MKYCASAMMMVLILGGAGVAFAQSQNSEEGPRSPVEPSHQHRPQSKDHPPEAEADRATDATAGTEGMWPSRKLTRLLLTRWAVEMGGRLDLDETQQSKVREVVVSRWDSFLRENRSTLGPLLNEYIEMRMGIEAPAKKEVQSWAKRAIPAFARIREQVELGTGEFRELLNPRQRSKFELQVLQLNLGLQLAQQRLKMWHEGQFQPDEVWQAPGSGRRKRRAEKPSPTTEEGGKSGAPARSTKPADQIALELASWDKYVETFIRLYDLDEGQRAAVLSCLSELKQRATAHRDKRREEIAILERRLQDFAGSPPEPSELKVQLTELYGPIDDMFAELKRRIEQVPTAVQNAEAARSEANRGVVADDD